MNDRELKQALKNVYQPPEAKREKAFLNQVKTLNLFKVSDQIHFPGQAQGRVSALSYKGFLFSQLTYIRPWTWLISLGIFAAALAILRQHQPEASDQWIISGLFPFAALGGVMELNRSARYKMEELELASRFSLKAVMLARMGILGAGNILLLFLILPFAVVWGQLSLLESGFYILCPYCLTTAVCLVIVRRWRENENIYACGGAAGGISAIYLFWEKLRFIPGDMELIQIGGIILILLGFMVWEYRKYVLSMGEVWIWS